MYQLDRDHRVMLRALCVYATVTLPRRESSGEGPGGDRPREGRIAAREGFEERANAQGVQGVAGIVGGFVNSMCLAELPKENLRGERNAAVLVGYATCPYQL